MELEVVVVPQSLTIDLLPRRTIRLTMDAPLLLNQLK